MPTLLQDLRYGLRTLTRTPGFTLVAMAVLALGIGVNATIFSVANAFFLRPLPAADPDQVVRVYSNRFSNTTYATYRALSDRNSTLTGLAAFTLRSFGVRIDGGDTEHAFGEIVTGNYFPLLGVAAERGRLLSADDDRAGAPPAVVLSHAFWNRRFGGAGDVVGRTIALNGQPFTIVGVVPRRFTGVLAPLAGDLWLPLASDAVLRPMVDEATRLSNSFHLIGRLKPGANRASAQADLDTIGRQLRQAAGDPPRTQPAVTVYGGTMLHPEVSQPVTAFTAVLMTVVALVLAIVCVNLANLVLARAAGREAELAVRRSLGAPRGRLVRQLLTENLILSLGGAAGGLAIAVWTTRLLMAARLPAPVPIALDLSVDWRVLAFTTLIAVGATLAFGAVPAFTASGTNLVDALRGVGAASPRHGRLRSVFLVAQVSMSVLLLVTAGLFIRSFQSAQSISPGFDATGVLTAAIDLETRGYSADRGREFIRALTERLEAAPGIVAANIVDTVPLTLSNTANYFLREGDSTPSRDQAPPTPLVYMNAVGPGHFKTLTIGLLSGRDFTSADDARSPGVAIVNETLARQFWPGENAIGRRLRRADGNSQTTIEVVGVVRDSKYVTVGEEPRPFLYSPLAQVYTPRITVMARTTGTPAAALAAIKQQVDALDTGLPVFAVATLEDATAISLLPARIGGLLLAGLGALALVLAALGIYGVLSFIVRMRTREIGVRVAVGATPGAVAALVVRQAMRWTVIGAGIGVGLSLLLTRLIAGFLYGVSPTDPWTFGGVLLLLTMVASLAAYIPARRASRVDPLVALRML